MDSSGRRRLALLVIGLMLPLAACSEDKPESPDTVAGDTIQGRLDSVEAGQPADIVTPAGKLSVAFGDPLGHLQKDQTTDLKERNAPDGGTFVPIVWSFNNKVFGQASRIFGESEPLELTLVVDGEKYDVVPPPPGEKHVDFLAVDGSAKEISLEATYGDKTQTLDAATGEIDKGAAAGLYDLAGIKVQIKNCPVKKWLTNPTVFIQFTCKYTTAIASPYVHGHWAEPGHTFVAINIATNLQLFATGTFGESIANYDATDVTDKSTLEGEKPLGTLQDTENAGTSSGILVFDVKGKLPKKMHVLREYKLVLSGGTGKVDEPEHRTTQVGGDLDLVY